MKNFFLFKTNKNLNNDQKIEQHLFEIKILCLFILLFSIITFFVSINNSSKNNKKQFKKKNAYKFERIDDIENKTACLWDGKGKPCYEVKYEIRQENKNLNDFQKIKLSEEELTRLKNYNAVVIVYKDKFEGSILAVSCPSLSINKKDRANFMIKDFVNKKLKTVLGKDDKITCPPMISK